MSNVFTFPPAAGGSAPGGAADGANRQYHYATVSVPSRVVDQVVFEFNPTPEPVAVFDLLGAGPGDELTVYVESTPATFESYQALVIPAGFTDGSIRIINRGYANFFLVTADSLGSPFQPDSGRAPGVTQVLPGTTEFLVVSTLTEAGERITQVNSLRAIVKTTSVQSHVFAAPAPGASADFYFPFTDYALWMLEYQFPRSVRVYADQPVECKLEVIGWNQEIGEWSNVFAEATWTTQPSGEPDFSSINIILDLPKFGAGNGMYSTLMPDSIARLTLTGFPGAAPTTATAVIGIKTMRDFA